MMSYRDIYLASPAMVKFAGNDYLSVFNLPSSFCLCVPCDYIFC